MTDFTELPDLANARLGGVVLAANDDFFAPKENLLLESEPVWKEGVYTERGKWMDGWETRRRRQPGHDWCLVRLGLPGIVRGVVVDTSFFRGNFPESCAIEAAALQEDPTLAGEAHDSRFREILPRSPLAGHEKNRFAIPEAGHATHLLLRIYPDGGVARLRAHGEVGPDWRRLPADQLIDLAAIEHGGRVIDASDMFFGHRHRLIYPGSPRGMFDGWETKRRRGPGHDWAIVSLGAPGTIRRAIVDTSHFKGNAPGACSLQGAATKEVPAADSNWFEILPRQELEPDDERAFEREIAVHPAARHVRLNIFPDGGVARLRLFGIRAPDAG